MDWTAQIDAYCERSDPGLWAEPLNAVTNLSFILAGVAGLYLWQTSGRRDYETLLLILVIFSIGIGSFLFHTLATRWARLADVIPITLFIYVFFFLAMRRFVGLELPGAIGVTAIFFGASAAFGAVLPPGFLNGSGSYLPALVALLAVGQLLRARQHEAAEGLLLAAGVFAVSLFARSIDHAVCTALPDGTHFIWHILNGIVLFILISTMLKARTKRLPQGSGRTD